jgi:hypothetical protein
MDIKTLPNPSVSTHQISMSEKTTQVYEVDIIAKMIQENIKL